MCSKIRYPSRRAALIAMTAIAAQCRRRGRRFPVAAYPCPSCRAWHLTSKPLSQGWAARFGVTPPATP